ncbi:hydroxymethylglutaryl-CoA lyase [Salipiger aestuarii]|uniref:hydroxymethylglutaryl-CoA lyase n=1 Tax=Salipiger aestuarii TaxID=568098 RepID=A0A327YEB2_9RHOB|nr:hydroxymethylglutaryl-CoA lyase [Salipiger aestuarii]EIE51909.1 hydroxymethylglutaryl-CoA lyase [Citreicella sp. 357]KAA8612900.1 hydroxymethylglutaryl-CoA lyase [Salipiger aestuarii]KAB2542190.1 hydroxymethylglutaryl-CoA lyase [Salipiger aestuarii]RAK16839.1 hydroxymethylglutaryl-CoA lyase [Salipiger aestuarii]
MTGFVEIFEVGPRDGLQNEARAIPVAEKIALVDCLSRAGFRRIECASFVSPKWVPQMADSGAVLAGITRREGVTYAALTPNMKGFDAAMAAGADEVAIFGSASEGFSRANINAGIDESLARFRPVVAAAKARGVKVRGYVSCVVECPYDGAVSPAATARVAGALRAMGCYEVSLGDTIGRGTPEAVDAMLGAVTQEMGPDCLAGHFHDTAGRALANVEVALARGLRVFDAAVGGLGGCPYAPGAAGNVATEAVAVRLAELGYRTGLALDVLNDAAAQARAMRG